MARLQVPQRPTRPRRPPRWAITASGRVSCYQKQHETRMPLIRVHVPPARPKWIKGGHTVKSVHTRQMHVRCVVKQTPNRHQRLLSSLAKSLPSNERIPPLGYEFNNGMIYRTPTMGSTVRIDLDCAWQTWMWK